MTEPFLNTEQQLANQALVLRNHGHINIEQLVQIYEIQRFQEPNSTYVEYIDPEGNVKTSAIDLTLQQVVLEASQLGLEQEESANEAWGLTPD